MIRTIIIDDEAPARDELRFLLEPFEDIEILGEADNAATAVPLITKRKPDLIFLDVQMRGLSGIELATIIQEISPKSHIIFATAYNDYALKAFELNASDYLMKPIEEERLEQTIQRIRKFFPTQEEEDKKEQTSSPLAKLAVEKDGHILLIDTKSIYYITGESGRLEVATSTGLYESHKTLSELQSRFQNTPLYRVHRSYIVNLEAVQEILPWFKGTYWLRVPSPSSKLVDIPVSKSQVKQVRELLGIN